MELKLLNEQGQASATLQASDALFGREYNEALIHQVVVAYMANARSGNVPRRAVTKCPIRPTSRGVKKARVAPVPV